MKYIINEIPPSNNKFIGRTNRWEYQKVKKQWAELILFLCSPKPKTPIKKSVVRIKYYFKTRVRHDPDNYSGKMILDGLVKAGIIEDDSFGNITLELSGGYDKENPRTEIEIVEIETEEQIKEKAMNFLKNSY